LKYLFTRCPEQKHHVLSGPSESFDTLISLFMTLPNLWFPATMDQVTLLFNGDKVVIYEGLESRKYDIAYAHCEKGTLLIYHSGELKAGGPEFFVRIGFVPFKAVVTWTFKYGEQQCKVERQIVIPI